MSKTEFMWTKAWQVLLPKHQPSSDVKSWQGACASKAAHT